MFRKNLIELSEFQIKHAKVNYKKIKKIFSIFLCDYLESNSND
jgi:hypothetical protein